MSGLERVKKCTQMQRDQFKNMILGTSLANAFGPDKAG
jgi:hypothetical protein